MTNSRADGRTVFEVEISESGDVLTIRCYAGQTLTPEEFAAELSDFVEDLRSGDAEIIIIPDENTH